MYCPNCGSQVAETTKFCRQCGLPLNQLAEYVASGGTAPLLSQPLNRTIGGLTPKQQLVLTIMLIVFAPALFGLIGEQIGVPQVAGIPAILMPLGIVWAIFRYKNQHRRLREQQSDQTMQTPQQHFEPQTYRPPLQAPPTNPIATPSGGSVTEAETEQLRDRRQ